MSAEHRPAARSRAATCTTARRSWCARSPEDKKLLVDDFERLSEESRYRCSFHEHARAVSCHARGFTEVDHSDREADIAIESSRDRRSVSHATGG